MPEQLLVHLTFGPRSFESDPITGEVGGSGDVPKKREWTVQKLFNQQIQGKYKTLG